MEASWFKLDRVFGLLGYGGVSVFVILFVIVPIARPLFKEIDLSWHLFPGIYFFGVATFVMSMLPGTPQIQNIIPTKYLGTTAMAAPALGLIASALVITANYFLLGWMIRRSKSRGEGYAGTDPFAAKSTSTQSKDDKDLPNIWLAFMPSGVLLVLLNIIKVDILWALLGGIAALAVVGLTHKEAYKPIFMLAVLTPLFTNAIALVLATVLY